MSLVKVEGGWQPHRNGKPMMTPAGKALVAPTEALAEGVLAEWAGIKGPVHPSKIPFTQYLNTALDHVAPAPDAAVAGFLSHAESDTLCFRVEEPKALQERQAKEWDPWLDWLEKEISFRPFVFTGLTGMKQDQDVLKALRTRALAYDPLRLLALSQAAGLLGSATLAYAVLEGQLEMPEALRLSMLEELFQSEEWGEPEEMRVRREDLQMELTQLAQFIDLLNSSCETPLK